MSRSAGWCVLVGLSLLLGSGRGEEPKAEPDARPVDGHGDPLPRGARARFGTVRFRHGGAVSFVRCLPDGKTVLSHGADQMLRFWEAGTGKELRHIKFVPEMPSLGGQELVRRRGIFNARQAWFLDPNGQFGRSLSIDGRILAALDNNGTVIKVRDLIAEKVLHELKVSAGSVRFLALSPDDRTVAAAVMEQDNNNGTQLGRIRMWEVASGKELAALVGPVHKQEGLARFQPNHFVFSPDSKRVAAVGQEFNGRNGVVRIWVLGSDREPVRLLEHGGTGGPVVFSPDGKLLVEVSANPVTGANAGLHVWDTATGKEIRELGAQRSANAGLMFSPDGKLLADFDSSQSQVIHLWDLATGRETATITNGAMITAFTFSPDGKLLAVAGNDENLRLFEAATGKEVHVLKSSVGSNPFQFGVSQALGPPMSFSPDGKALYTLGRNRVSRWDVATGKEILLGGNDPADVMYDVVFTPDGKSLLTAGEDGVLSWDIATGRSKRLVETPKGEGEEPLGAGTMALSWDGKVLAVAWRDGQIGFYEAATGKEVQRFESGGNVTSLAFAGDGKSLVAGTSEGRVDWWDVRSGKLLRQLAGPPRGTGDVTPEQSQSSNPVFVAVAPDGLNAAGLGMDGALLKVRFWELSTGKLRRQLVVDNLAGDLPDRARLGLDDGPAPQIGVSGVPQLAFAPDGKNIVLGSGPAIELRELRHGREVRQYAIYGQLQGLAFSPNGKLLAAASDDGSIRVWDAATGAIRAELRGHRGGLHALAFSPDGQTLVSTGADAALVFWDLKRSLELDAPANRRTEQDLTQLWQSLSGEDGEKAFHAMQRLAEAPEQAVPWLASRLKPVPALDKEQLAKLITDLEHDRFDQRKKAAAELERLAELAAPALQKRLADDPPLDLKQRLEKLLAQATGPTVVPELVRTLRGLEVLEQIGTPEARQVIGKIAQGAADSRVTQAAKGALARLGKE